MVLALEADWPRTAHAVPVSARCIDLLKAYFHLDDRDGGQTDAGQGHRHGCVRLDDALSPTLPAFLTLLDVPVDDPAVARPRVRSNAASASWRPSHACCCARVRSSRWC